MRILKWPRWHIEIVFSFWLGIFIQLSLTSQKSCDVNRAPLLGTLVSNLAPAKRDNGWGFSC